MNLSSVEKKLIKNEQLKKQSTKIPYFVLDSFPDLGLVTSLRFLEWVLENPKGVVSLPTGKTPEYFIKWTNYFIKNWDLDNVKTIRKKYGLLSKKKPDFSKLQFVQIDEFYPLNPKQHNSFYNYVCKYYIEGFGMI